MFLLDKDKRGDKDKIDKNDKSPFSRLDLRWPALPSGDSEEGQKGPQHIVIMELIFFPLSRHGGHLVFVVV